MITLIDSEDGDYQWLYDEEFLLCEGHSISIRDFAFSIGLVLEEKTAKIDPYNIPEKLSDFNFVEE
mgnify:CR=1 FL=1